jgi:exodeoxyribonuclease VII small subunit
MAEKLSFEKALAELEKIVEALERGELSLEESIRKFEEGVALAGRCAELLKEAELKVQKLVKRADGAFDLDAMEKTPEERTGSGEDS